MKRLIPFFTLASLIIALQNCGQTSTEAEAAPATEVTPQEAVDPVSDLDGFFTEEIPGSDLVRVFKEDADGNILEDGFLKNGVKQGPWLTYERVFIYPKSITNYDNGVVHGIYMEFTPSGQVALQAFFRGNTLHGSWSRFKAGRMEASGYYKEGVLHGVYKEFMPLFGRLQKEIHYKDGEQHGLYRYYNDDGQITMEYFYKNGKKKSGGIVDPPRDPEPAE